MHFSLAAVFAGACLLCMYAALCFLGQGFQDRELTAVMAADPTTAPNNPNWIVFAILPEGEDSISNDGGPARDTPAPSFATYNEAFARVNARYPWLLPLETVCTLLGIALMFGGVVGLCGTFLRRFL